MNHLLISLSCMSAIAALSSTAMAADADAGKTLFGTQCLLCHTAEAGDGGGAQGPSLHGIYGHQAAADPQFGYTDAMKDSGLTWDAATLDRFLAAPTKVVPGSAMVIPVPDNGDRADVIAYLQQASLKADDETQAAAPAAGGEDWKNDRPGRVHRIDIDHLPAPFATEAARNFPKVVDRPDGAEVKLPEGFHFSTFATGFEGPRVMVQAGNGDIFLAETRGGRVTILHAGADGTMESKAVYASGLTQPMGMAFYPNAQAPEWLYVAESNRVVRYAYKPGDTKAGKAEVIVPSLPTGGHYTRDIVFSADGKRMFVSVGSASNVAETMEKKSPSQAKAYDDEHGLGAAWGSEEDRAAVLAFDVDGGNKELYATGLRNCVGLTIQPATGDLWCTVNERDLLGDNLVPDYSTRVKEGAFYGWPWYYFGNHEDPRRAGERPDLAGKATVPDVPYQAHSAALNLLFYQANDGASAFPDDYVGQGLAVLHGSWNRAFRTGHKIVRVPIENGKPTGSYVDFLTGFIVDNGNSWARPTALVQLADGSLLLADDGNDTIYRISYQK
jgi:glucose/arabinose dehydrogenase/mono/diheme cytochrome c family protein